MGFPARPRPTLFLGKRDLPPDWPPPPPLWAWAFAVPCFVLIAFGGAIPAGVGAGAGMGCLALAKIHDLPLGVRLGLCAAIVVAAWLGVFAIALALQSALR